MLESSQGNQDLRVQESGEKGTIGRPADLRTFVESFLYDQLESKKLHSGQWLIDKEAIRNFGNLTGKGGKNRGWSCPVSSTRVTKNLNRREHRDKFSSLSEQEAQKSNTKLVKIYPFSTLYYADDILRNTILSIPSFHP